MRGCRRCGKSHKDYTRGVHFVISDAVSGRCLNAYDVCQDCMEQHSPLIVPAEVLKTGAATVRVSYASFGDKTA